MLIAETDVEAPVGGEGGLSRHTVMSQLQIKMRALDAQTVWLGLDETAMQLQAAAKAAGLADEVIDAHRSDALVAWANNALADPNAPRRHGRRHRVQFIIDLPSLLGLADNPAELAGFEPISRPWCDRAAEAEWRRMVVDRSTATSSTTAASSTGHRRNSRAS